MQSDTATTERASPPVWGIDAIGGKYSPTVVEADGTVVALVPAKPWRTEAEALAITRLIAAAPQLLAFAERARAWLEQQTPPAGDTGGFAVIAAADHVIALANGEPQ